MKALQVFSLERFYKMNFTLDDELSFELSLNNILEFVGKEIKV
jgi:hypothetical protein